MRIRQTLGAALAAAALLASATPAAAEGASDAEKLRKLDMMLMVTSLRCRTGADNFQADYQRFTASHSSELGAATRALIAELGARVGSAGAEREFDRISVRMANAYGQGHPRLSCGELRVITQGLAETRGSARLVAAADDLVGDGR